MILRISDDVPGPGMLVRPTIPVDHDRGPSMEPEREYAPPVSSLRSTPASPHLILATSQRLRAAIFFGLYLVQGIPSGFALTAVANYLAARGLDPVVIAAFAARIGIPWSVQFLWGPLIDRFQGSPMGRRKPWVLGAQLAAFLASLGVIAVRDPATQVTALSVAFLIHGLFASVQDASVDAMAISIIPEAERGRINACMRAGIMVGAGLGAAVWATLIHDIGFTAAAIAQSAVLLTMTLLTAFVREQPCDSLVPWGQRSEVAATILPDDSIGPNSTPDPSLGHVFSELARGFFVARSLVIFALVVLVYTGEAVFIQAFPRYLIRDLHWSDADASRYQGVGGTVVGLLTALVGFVVADRLGPRRLMIGMMVLIGGFLVGFGLLGRWWEAPGLAASALVLWYMFDPGFSVACMPVLMGLCRKGVEGSQFTAYMALVNLAGAGGAVVSGMAQEVVAAPAIGLITGLVVVAAIPPAVLALREPRSSVAAASERFD